jgi:hypothetical protein
VQATDMVPLFQSFSVQSHDRAPVYKIEKADANWIFKADSKIAISYANIQPASTYLYYDHVLLRITGIPTCSKFKKTGPALICFGSFTTHFGGILLF